MTTFAAPLNNVSTRLAVAYTAGSANLIVSAGDGAKLPPLVGPRFYRITVARAAVAWSPTITTNDYTIFKVVGVSGDALTLAGTLDGTSDRGYAAGDVVEVRVTAGSLGEIHDAVHMLEDSLYYSEAGGF